jgi:hypothetical protein
VLKTDRLGRRYREKPGRPPRDHEPADTVLSVRLTKAEHARLASAADVNGVTMIDFCRLAINEAADECGHPRVFSHFRLRNVEARSH